MSLGKLGNSAMQLGKIHYCSCFAFIATAASFLTRVLHCSAFKYSEWMIAFAQRTAVVVFWALTHNLPLMPTAISYCTVAPRAVKIGAVGLPSSFLASAVEQSVRYPSFNCPKPDAFTKKAKQFIYVFILPMPKQRKVWSIQMFETLRLLHIALGRGHTEVTHTRSSWDNS